jgi:formylglycine-generating enzyme
MKTRILLTLILLLGCSAHPDLLYSQAFEQSPVKKWDYSANPEPDRLIRWGRTDDPTAPEVFNVSAAQRSDGSMLVDIHYDILDANNDLSDVSLLLSNDSGSSFAYAPNPANLSGDIGAGIASGSDKHIIWNAGVEGIDFDSISYRVRVLAEDGTFMGSVASPAFNPEPGNYSTAQTVSITCATDNVSIYYTLDGSEPDENAMLYNTPINISETTTIKAKAYKDGWLASGISVAEYEIPAVPANFVFVEGGTIDPYDGIFSDGLTVSSFFIDKYELTQAGYEAVMGVNPSYFGDNPNHPVEMACWFDAIEYCNRRSMLEGITPCYSYLSYGTDPDDWPVGWNTGFTNYLNVSCDFTANSYRLPTEAEWEYAARGGLDTNGYYYSGSDDLNAVAWYSGNTDPMGTRAVGIKQSNELGLYDMSGNVREWCWDQYSSMSISLVVRGGSWYGDIYNCANSYRFSESFAPDGYNRTGFRIVRIYP